MSSSKAQVRVDPDGTLVVPPFECAWLTGDGCELRGGAGCVVFEARGETDVTVLLTPGEGRGSKRWQPLALQQQAAAAAQHPNLQHPAGAQTPSSSSGLVGCVQPNYTVIFGSHRNSSLKVEKSGSTVSQVQGVPGARLLGREFQRLWVDYCSGIITVGTDEPCVESISHQWVDADPLPGIASVGLSCWDRHVSYRAIQVLPSHRFQPLAALPRTPATGSSPGPVVASPVAAALGMGRRSVDACVAAAYAAGSVPTLFALVLQVLVAHLGAPGGPPVCRVAAAADLLLPTARPLYKACLDYLARNFAAVTAEGMAGNNNGFTALPAPLLADLLQQNAIPVSEKRVFDAALWWATRAGADDEQGPRSTPDIVRVLSLVRYPLMTVQELDLALGEPLVAAQPLLRALVEEAQGYTGGQPTAAGPVGSGNGAGAVGGGASISPPPLAGSPHPPPGALLAVENRRLLHLPSAGSGELGGALSMARFQRRVMPSSHECAFVCSGDGNGVLHLLGTAYGTQSWVNPVLARRVDVRASSPAGRHTDPRAIAGDKFPRVNFAGPRYVNGQPDTWWLVDLGPPHTLIPTYVTLRADGSGEYVRSWVLQGSTDLVSWCDLQHHKGDATFKQPGQYASWAVGGPAAKVPYRAFRLLLTGPSTSAPSPHNFPLASMELYGFLLHVKASEDTEASGNPTAPQSAS